jgi:hypothetical protein
MQGAQQAEGAPMIRLSHDAYDDLRGTSPQPAGGALRVGGATWDGRATVVCPVCAPAPVAGLIACADRYAALTGAGNPAQLPALLFDLNGDPWPLVHYFPAAGNLPDARRANYFAQVGMVAAHPSLDLRLTGERRSDLTVRLPASARWLVAGHLIEVLGQRPDILHAFLAQPRHFRLYTTAAAFEQDGGVAGGDYDADRERVQLGLSRLFEGFRDHQPGVAPFLHELGHMLDAFDAATGAMGHGRGLLPGLALEDGALFDADARRLFISGKTLELRRYAALQSGAAQARAGADLPIGHPYVFQNDGEFIAGYLELFLRTPGRFAALNPELFDAFDHLLRQDPRRWWPQDFAFYVRENEAAYLSGAALAPAGITVPAA